MRRVRFGLPAILACLLFALPASAGAAHKLHFGIAANTGGWGASAGAEQDRVKQTGVKLLREDLDWSVIESTNNAWDWAKYDALYLAAATRGLQILPILDSAPCWAVGQPAGTKDCWRRFPTYDADFADFAAHVATRYGPISPTNQSQGAFWRAHPTLDPNGTLASRTIEVWNEPYNDTFSYNNPDPARYARLYKAAVVAGRAANPATRWLVEANYYSVHAVNGTYTGVDWAGGMQTAVPDIGSYIDGIAIHPYPPGNDPDIGPSTPTAASFKNTDRIYADFASRGINKPIWITEVGYTACTGFSGCVAPVSPNTPEQQKAAYLKKVFDELATDTYGYVHAVVLFNWREYPAVSAFDGYFGIVKEYKPPVTPGQPCVPPPPPPGQPPADPPLDCTPVPAYFSFKNAIASYDGTPVPETMWTDGGGSTTKSVTVTFESNDRSAGFECAVGSGAWASCKSPKGVARPAFGSTTLSVRAKNDEATDPTPLTVTITGSCAPACGL